MILISNLKIFPANRRPQFHAVAKRGEMPLAAVDFLPFGCA
jgi:hypothetical protein